MTRCILAALVLAVFALALSLAGWGRGTGPLAAGLFGLTMILALLSLIHDSDTSAR